VVLVLVGCGGARSRTGFDQALAAADAAFQPGQPGFEDRVQRLLDAAGRDTPNRPEILWRRARLEVARGQASADPVIARDAFARGRAIAAGCLDAQPGVRRRRIAGDWRSAVQAVPEVARPCVAQLAWAWTRWFLAADPKGAALDRFTLNVLVAAGTGRENQWAEALLAGLDGDRRTADTLLLALSAVYPDDLAILADRIGWVFLPSGDEAAARDLFEELQRRVRPEVPRDVAALKQAERALARDVGAVPLPVQVEPVATATTAAPAPEPATRKKRRRRESTKHPRP
jgi:hypothetical protein